MKKTHLRSCLEAEKDGLKGGRPKVAAGFTLVEVAFALGICAFCLLAIFGLLQMGLTSSQTATEETGAANLLSMVATDLRETPVPGDSAFFKIPVHPVIISETPRVRFFDEWGQWTSELQADSRYRLSVKFLPGTTTDGPMPVLADVRVTWPAAADPGGAVGRIETLISMGRN